MISWLRYRKTANFFAVRKAISTKAIEDAFTSIRASAPSRSTNLFCEYKEALHGARWSAISFAFDREPSFLELPAGRARERIYGFLLIVEHRNHAAVFRSQLDLPTGFKTRHLKRLQDDRVDAVLAQADAVFEKMNLHTMGASRHALRSKTLEAEDLQRVLSPSSGNRYVRRAYRVRRGTEHLSTVPNTGRITARSERMNYDELIAWAVAVIDALNDEVPATSDFIRLFAKSIDLESLPHTTEPKYIGFDADILADDLFEVDEGERIRLVRLTQDDDAIPLSEEETRATIETLHGTFSIKKTKKEFRILEPETENVLGVLRIGKAAITLQSFDLAGIAGIYVETVNPPPGDPERRSLKSYINQEHLLVVLFSDLSVVYLDGSVYREDGLSTGGTALLGYIVGNPALNDANHEKGGFVAGQTVFDVRSLFRAIVDDVAREDDILICDDLNDEWADFIGVDRQSKPKKISFYHAKHEEDPGLGASALHIVVSQAIKNLAHLIFSHQEILAKENKWSELYRDTAIPRLARGTPATLTADLAAVNGAPDTIRRVVIVASALSRRQLADEFAAIAAGTSPKPYFVQLYWLLMGYVSACKEINAYPYVICRE